jgi:hypothetical protein
VEAETLGEETVSAAAVQRVIVQREQSDCGVAALASYLGMSYEDVLRAVAVEDRNQGRCGLWVRTMKRIASILGHTLRQRRAIDWEDGYGLLLLPDHVVVLRNGLVFDGDGTIWDADAYLSNRGLTQRDCDFLVAVE